MSEFLHESTRTSILSEFMNKSPKDAFKIWHFVFNKEYDYNSEHGIKKYKTFKANLKRIKDHNSKPDVTYTMGLNHLSDLTFEEVSEYYNLKPISDEEIREKMAGSIPLVSAPKLTLDNYFDDEEISSNVNGYATFYDYTKLFLAARNQGSCGSCWAFSALGAMEGRYNFGKSSYLTYYFSTQQLLDCNTLGYSCNGGWFTAWNLYKTQYIMKDSDYPYKAVKGTCKYSSTKNTLIKIKNYTTATTPDTTYALLKNGPMAVAIQVISSFYSYKTGVWGDACKGSINHGVVLAGYGFDSTTNSNYWLIRNSWGTSWGSNGYVKIKDNAANNGSCFVTKYAYQPNF